MQQLIPTEYVNVFGQTVDIDEQRLSAERNAMAAKRKPAQESYHKGWRVVGFPPGYLQQKFEENRAEHARTSGAV